MDFNIHKVKVSIDHVTVTSDDMKILTFNPYILSRYRYLPKKPTRKKKHTKHKRQSYEFFHEFRHKKTRNKVHIFNDRLDTVYDR